VDLITPVEAVRHLTVAILKNPVKNPLFTLEERVEMLTRPRDPGERYIATFDGLMVELHASLGFAVLRGFGPFRTRVEFQMALMNRRLAPEIETVFLQPAGRYSFVSSRMVKDVFGPGGM